MSKIFHTLERQHVSFYTLDSLKILANRFGRHLVSYGSYHLFTTEPKSPHLFRLCLSSKISRLVNRFNQRPSLLEPDLQFVTRTKNDEA